MRFGFSTPALSRILRVSRLRLRSLSRSEALDAEVENELAFHVEQLTREHIAGGMAPDEARRAARRGVGNVALIEEQCRDQRRGRWLHDFQQDLIYGLRMLRRSPGFTAMAAVSLALGIGGNAAILGVIDAVLLQSLPLPNAERLVNIKTVPFDSPWLMSDASLPDYLAWKEKSRVFDAIGASLVDQRDFAAQDGAPAERLVGQAFDPGLFATLGIEPLIGRVFTEAETETSAPDRVVVISHRLWQRHFDADPGVLGKQVRLNGITTTIIGVMPRDFRYGDRSVEYWVPLRVNRFQLQGTARFFVVTARLLPGVTIPQARADLDAIAAQLSREFPDRHKGWGVRVRPLHEALLGWTREPLLTLQAAVTLVLLIACVNVAGLLLARGSVRQHEMTLRVALGAGRGRIVRQLLTETVLLSVAGGVLGLFVAWIGLRALVTMSPPPNVPGIAEVGLNARVLALLAVLSIASGLGFGVAPALAGSRRDLTASLEHSGTRTHNRSARRSGLVAAQIALALVLLIGYGLLMNSFIRLAGRGLNFDPEGLLTFEFRIPSHEYTQALGSYHGFPYFQISPAPALTMERVYERLRRVPGAESVAGISYLPVTSLLIPGMTVTLDGAQSSTATGGAAAYFLVTPNLFAALKTPIVRGRDFNARDTVTAPWVAVVNETTAARFWPGEDPIGKRFTLTIVPDERPREVIGIVRDIPVRRRQIRAEPVIYASYLQQPSRYRGPWGGMFGQMTFVVRHSGDPISLVPAVRRAVAEVDPNRALASVATADQLLDSQMQGFRDYAIVLGVFAFTATMLAAIGVYGVMAYTVTQRTREIGIRKALGADRREVVALVGRRALGLVVTGLVLGLTGSLALTRLIASQLWGVTPTDPATFAVVSLLLGCVALLACLVPALRAVAVDPTVALRSE